jgi:hypothetical protein
MMDIYEALDEARRGQFVRREGWPMASLVGIHEGLISIKHPDKDEWHGWILSTEDLDAVDWTVVE